MEQGESKTGVIAILLGSFIALTDALGILLVFFGLDDFLILDILTWPASALYFLYNGRSGSWYNTAANMLELIPYVGALPIRTVGFFLGLNSGKKLPLSAVQDIKIRKPKGTIQSSTSISAGSQTLYPKSEVAREGDSNTG